MEIFGQWFGNGAKRNLIKKKEGTMFVDLASEHLGGRNLVEMKGWEMIHSWPQIWCFKISI